MATAKMTLTGFVNYNEHLFDEFSNLPDGIDGETLAGCIIMEGGEFEVMYANPFMMQSMVGTWVRKWYRTIEKWITAVNSEYEPIWNKDSYIERTERHTGTVGDSGNETVNGSNSRTRVGRVEDNDDIVESESTNSSVTTVTHGETSGETINQISAYDVNDFANKDKSNQTGEYDETETQTGVVSRSDRIDNDREINTNETINDVNSGTNVKSNTRTNNLTDTVSEHEYGNIGITMVQDMLEKEYTVAEWNLYQHVTDLFLNEFCIMVYV